VADAFTKVLDTLRAGKAPDSAFRAYLLTALRHAAYDRTRKNVRVDLSEDMELLTGAGSAAFDALTMPFSDPAVSGLERTMAANAFARLPERWQAVLWHVEIEQQSPTEVATLLGLTPNGISALAYRAWEGLRQAYLQVHLAMTSAERCHATAERLGAWTRHGLGKRERAQVEARLDECDQCQALAAELADINSAPRAVIAPVVLGGAAWAYLVTAASRPRQLVQVAARDRDRGGGRDGAGGRPKHTGTPPPRPRNRLHHPNPRPPRFHSRPRHHPPRRRPRPLHPHRLRSHRPRQPAARPGSVPAPPKLIVTGPSGGLALQPGGGPVIHHGPQRRRDHVPGRSAPR
jgi:DNA-directed RNA polymerase specialized sigma24 family protein